MQSTYLSVPPGLCLSHLLPTAQSSSYSCHSCSSWSSSAFLLVAVLIAGCSSGPPGPKLVPVAGTVTLDDKPLGAADVMFIPTEETRGQAAVARTDPSGKFELLTSDRKHKGAATGTYKVTISKLVNPDGTDFIPDPNSGPMDTGGFRELLPTVYTDRLQTPLSAEIPDSGATNLEFKLKSKAR